jgi:cysteinyl-tRNA synthetase
VKLYNTLTRTIQEFEPLDRATVTMYVCGPTVYDDPHIGHARSAYVFDVLRRYLASKGFQARFVRNVTDVDDKIIEKARQELGARSQEQGTRELQATCQEVAERYLRSYHETMGRLGIQQPEIEPKATEHVVPDMTDFIAKLLLNGVAYEAGGDVYFAVRKFPGYGKLSNRALDELQAGARVEPGEGKRDPLDFALWKAAKPGEPSWSSPWGNGRPGWHIECSTMSAKYLGETFDIHGGGVDLVFPHHENEIAQAQALGKPFARYWVHNGLLTVNGEKMSKSLGNFITVEDALKRCGGQADVLKVFFLSAQYRSPLDYTDANIQAARGRYRRLVHCFHRVMNRDLPTESGEQVTPPSVRDLHEAFLSAMDDDLNTPKALAALDGLVTAGYAASEPLDRVAALRTMRQLGETLGLFGGLVGRRLSSEQRQLLAKREEARRRQDFATADQIRVGFSTQGLAIEDTPEGPVVLPKS